MAENQTHSLLIQSQEKTSGPGRHLGSCHETDGHCQVSRRQPSQDVLGNAQLQIASPKSPTAESSVSHGATRWASRIWRWAGQAPGPASEMCPGNVTHPASVLLALYLASFL